MVTIGASSSKDVLLEVNEASKSLTSRSLASCSFSDNLRSRSAILCSDPGPCEPIRRCQGVSQSQMSFITSEAALWRLTALCLRPGVCPALLNWSWRLVTVPSFNFSSDLTRVIIMMMMMIMRIIMRGTTIRRCKLTAVTGSSSPTLHMKLQVWTARVVDCHSLSGPRQAGMV